MDTNIFDGLEKEDLLDLLERFSNTEILPKYVASSTISELKNYADEENIDNLLKLAEDVESAGRVIKVLKNLKPLIPSDTLSQYEVENYKLIVVAISREPLVNMPLLAGSPFSSVRIIAKWRLRIGR